MEMFDGRGCTGALEKKGIEPRGKRGTLIGGWRCKQRRSAARQEKGGRSSPSRTWTAAAGRPRRAA